VVTFDEDCQEKDRDEEFKREKVQGRQKGKGWQSVREVATVNKENDVVVSKKEQLL